MSDGIVKIGIDAKGAQQGAKRAVDVFQKLGDADKKLKEQIASKGKSGVGSSLLKSQDSIKNAMEGVGRSLAGAGSASDALTGSLSSLGKSFAIGGEVGAAIAVIAGLIKVFGKATAAALEFRKEYDATMNNHHGTASSIGDLHNQTQAARKTKKDSQKQNLFKYQWQEGFKTDLLDRNEPLVGGIFSAIDDTWSGVKGLHNIAKILLPAPGDVAKAVASKNAQDKKAAVKLKANEKVEADKEKKNFNVGVTSFSKGDFEGQKAKIENEYDEKGQKYVDNVPMKAQLANEKDFDTAQAGLKHDAEIRSLNLGEKINDIQKSGGQVAVNSAIAQAKAAKDNLAAVEKAQGGNKEAVAAAKNQSDAADHALAVAKQQYNIRHSSFEIENKFAGLKLSTEARTTAQFKEQLDLAKVRYKFAHTAAEKEQGRVGITNAHLGSNQHDLQLKLQSNQLDAGTKRADISASTSTANVYLGGSDEQRNTLAAAELSAKSDEEFAKKTKNLDKTKASVAAWEQAKDKTTEAKNALEKYNNELRITRQNEHELSNDRVQSMQLQITGNAALENITSQRVQADVAAREAHLAGNYGKERDIWREEKTGETKTLFDFEQGKSQGQLIQNVVAIQRKQRMAKLAEIQFNRTGGLVDVHRGMDGHIISGINPMTGKVSTPFSMKNGHIISGINPMTGKLSTGKLSTGEVSTPFSMKTISETKKHEHDDQKSQAGNIASMANYIKKTYTLQYKAFATN